ncbi:MAG: peptide deformylase [Tannerella sp.]|jgi:peptide deformylase|nr:peptide deformylase [Tannerella sp.]
MILPIYTYGQPILRKAAEPVNKDCVADMDRLIDDMFETMYKAEGIGLAAPQVGHSIRVLVLDAHPLKKDHPECAYFKREIINPELIEESKEKISLEEGCLSFPGIHETIQRAKKITVKYFDRDFVEHVETLEGFAARIVLHEMEHLAGHLFIDNISPIRKQLNKGKLNSLIKGKADAKYKIKSVG